jgi:segregation and condensation protein A
MREVAYYQVKLQNIDFEGPLDLLLYLIRKNEINIYDIPIAFILREYLIYLKALQEIDVQVSSEFLAMVGKLMYIKSKMLLPSQLLDEDPDDPWLKQFEDPRAELVKQLENRARLIAIRDALEHIRGRELQAMYTFHRGSDPAEAFPPPPGADFGELALTDLLGHYENVLARGKEKAPIDMKLEAVSMKDIIKHIMSSLKRGVKTLFRTLVGKKPTLPRIITSFLVLLDLCMDGKITLHQDSYEAELEVERI